MNDKNKKKKLTRVSIYNKTTFINSIHEYTIYFEKLYDIFIIFELIKSNEYMNDNESIHIFCRQSNNVIFLLQVKTRRESI